MEDEARIRFVNKFLQISELLADESIGTLAIQNSRYYGEYYDIKNRVRSPEDHPHHPLNSLRKALARNWKEMREVQREIKKSRT